MAAPRNKPEVLPLDEQETLRPPFPAFPEVEDSEEDRAIENVLADLGGVTDAKVNVYLLEPGKQRAFVGTFDPTNFSVEEIQRTFGPGDYEIQVRVDGRIRARRQLRIAAPKFPQVPALASSPAVDKQEIGKLVETMNAGFQSMANMLAQTVQSIASNQPKPKTTQDMLNEMLLMKQILGGSESAPKSDMEMFMKGLEFAKDITPREGEPGAGEIVLEAIKNFGGVLAQAKMNAPAGVALTPQPAHVSAPIVHPQAGNMTIAPNAPAEAAPQQPSQEDQMSLMRKMYLNLLLSNAKADNDPTTYAAMAIDLQGENTVLEFARHPQWFELMCGELPEAANYREWFTEMRNAVFMLTEQPNPDIQSAITTSPAPAPADALPQTEQANAQPTAD